MSLVELERVLAAAFHQAVRDELAELRGEVRALAAQVEHLRRALPAQLVSMREAADRLGLSLSTVRRMAKHGDLPCRRMGRSVRVDLAVLHPMTDDEVAQAAARARGK